MTGFDAFLCKEMNHSNPASVIRTQIANKQTVVGYTLIDVKLKISRRGYNWYYFM